MGAYRLCILFCLMASASADDGWDDFANNLATDLAPLITLFGEQLTKQYLSESITMLDDFIFALAPLGILTATVSAIRVCGNSSIRAFIGRAQEGPGSAERELLSCVSESTAEIFSNVGISRIFGKPQILEVVVCDDETGQSAISLEPLHKAVKESSDDVDVDVPNLSLNKGIKRRSRIWFYIAAILGCCLQIGVVIFSALTVFLWPESFKKDENPVAAYAFPLFMTGTILLDTGMFLCALIIERSSKKHFLPLKDQAKIYWLQPGGQKVGEQVFDAFAGASSSADGNILGGVEYVRSVKKPSRIQTFYLLTSVSFTTMGFIFQFIGLRGLHSAVTLAQLGSTLVMAVVRTSLRTQRIDENDNIIRRDQQLVAYGRQELDWFAFHLHGAQSFCILSDSRTGENLVPYTHYDIDSIMQTRMCLADLTNTTFDDVPIRTMAHHLAQTLEMTVNLISSWSEFPLSSFDFLVPVKYQSDGNHIWAGGEIQFHVQALKNDASWKVSRSKLEAALGLWIWSLLRSDFEAFTALHFIKLLDRNHQTTADTYLYYHKWIQRQTSLEIVPRVNIVNGGGTFGRRSSESRAGDSRGEALVMSTESGLNELAAQDIYIHFLHSVLSGFRDLGGDNDIVISQTMTSQTKEFTVNAYNSRIEELAMIFESNKLGSHEDALVSIVPVLTQHNLLPGLAADSITVRDQVDNFVRDREWEKAFAIMEWVCVHTVGEDFERSVYEYGYFCFRGTIHPSQDMRKKALRCISNIMASERFEVVKGLWNHLPDSQKVTSQEQPGWWQRFRQQLGWMAWHMAESWQNQTAKESLENFHIDGDTISVGSMPGGYQPEIARMIFLSWLTYDDINRLWQLFSKHSKMFECAGHDKDEQIIALEWVIHNGHDALLHWLIKKWVNFGKELPREFLGQSFVEAANIGSSSAIRALRRQGADINFKGDALGSMTALMVVVGNGAEGSVLQLLENGADVHVKTNEDTALTMAASNGNARIGRLLLQFGAEIEPADLDNLSPLLLATKANSLDMVRLLLDRHADIQTCDIDGFTPFLSAAQDGYFQMVQLLVDRGARIMESNNRGQTALMLAARRNYQSIVAFLLSKKMPVNIKCLDGFTALDYARKGRHLEMASLLETHST